jgi:hypothetical protein
MGMIRVIAAVAALLVVVFFAVPMAVGDSSNACQALEKYKVSKAASAIAGGHSGMVYGVINGIGQAGATGNIAANEEADANPNTPTPISCTFEFWRVLFN